MLKKIFKKLRLSIIVAVILLLSFNANNALACEDPATATAALTGAYATGYSRVTLYKQQLKNFITIMTSTIDWMVEKRLDEFDANTRGWLSDWWQEKFLPALKDMTVQVGTNQIDQTKAIGMMMDQILMEEVIQKKKQRQLDAQRRYRPSELFCQIDSLGPSQTNSYQISRALNKGFTADDTPRRSNKKGTKAAISQEAEINEVWQEYLDNFCDHTKGDQGCDDVAPGVLSNRHKDLPDLLWQDKQTIDMSDANNRLLVNAAIRYLIYPAAADPLHASVIKSSDARSALLARRAEMARTNTLYNVVGQILAERVGGSGADTKDIRLNAGISAADASDNASYREIQEAMNRDKFLDIKYALYLIVNPEALTREQLTIGASRLQLMGDLYHRMEELLYMMSADYSRDLDKRKPSSAVDVIPF